MEAQPPKPKHPKRSALAHPDSVKRWKIGRALYGQMLLEWAMETEKDRTKSTSNFSVGEV